MLELQISHSLCTDCIAQVKLESQLRDAEAELARLTASKSTEYRALSLLKSATEAEVQQLRRAVKGKREVQRLYLLQCCVRLFCSAVSHSQGSYIDQQFAIRRQSKIKDRY